MSVGGRLLVVRDHAHARAFEEELGEGDSVWTLAELFDHLATWGLGCDDAGDDAGAGVTLKRDDDAALFACAAALSEQGPHAARFASDARALAAALAHGRTSAAEVARALEARARTSGQESTAAAELHWLLDRLQAADLRLFDAGVVDGPTALGRAVDRLARGERPSALARFAGIEVRGLVDPTDLEVRALLGLARAQLPLCATLPFDSVGRGLLAGVQPVLAAFEAAHDIAGLDVALDDVAEPAVGGELLAPFVRAWYAADGATVGAEVPVEVATLPDETAEAREVARVVAAWKEQDPDATVAIALRTVADQASARLVDALARHGLPARVRRRPLLDTPAARLLLDALALSLHGAPRDRLLAVLASPVRKGALPTEDAARVHRALRLAAARTDVEDGARPTGGYRHRLERFAEAADDTGQRDAARDALDRVQPLLALSAGLPRLAPLAVHLERIAALADALLDPDAHASCAAVLDALARARAASRRVAGERDAAVALAVALRLVEGLLRAAQAGEVDVDVRAPELLSLPELWGRTFDHVVVAGCVEGKLPRTDRAERLLSDTERASINTALGRPALRLFDDDPLEASPVPRAQALEPVWMLGALRSASRSLLLTAARRDARGRETAASVFLLEALRALGAGPHAQRAGRCFQRAASQADRAIAAARRRAATPADAPIEAARQPDADLDADLDAALRSRVDLARRMRDERARFFSQPAGASAVAACRPFAFAVSPERIARVFGASFGLKPERPLTPTRLESLAECRWYGFVKDVLKVDVELPAGNSADQRVLGILAHAVMERFFLERRRAQVPATRMTAADRQRVRTLLAEQAAPLLAGRATGHLGAIRAQVAWLETALVRAVSMLARDPPVLGVEPVDFELQVGASTRERPADWSSVPIDVGGRTIWLGGVIDRVDEGSGGRAVIDYKTSKTSSIERKVKEDALFTKHFQLLLYLRLLEHHRPTDASTALHGYLISLLDGTASPDVGRIDDLRARLLDDEHPEGLAAGLGRVIGPVLGGALLADLGDRCDGCRLRRTCRLPLSAVAAPAETDAERDAEREGAAPAGEP